MVKRILDVCFSAVLLLLALPVLLLAALVISFTSPGPVLFRQLRVGRGFQPFWILKLRTMAHAEAGLAYTLGFDPRITRFGRFLRRTKIDELPQLWNVLCGEMSLVGPRPVVPELAQEFHDYYVFLLRARPGLTDPSSLKYSQETRLLSTAADPLHYFKTVVTPDKIRLSFEYMGQANLWSDVRVMAMTALVCCFPAMSRMYGSAPENPAAANQPKIRRETPQPRSQVNESIFSYDRAFLEASAEERPACGPLPWIQLPKPEYGSEAEAMTANRSVSRL